MNPRSSSRKLPNDEWNFEPVPEAELKTCFWYEYIREAVSPEMLRTILGFPDGSLTEFGQFLRPGLLRLFLHGPIREHFAAQTPWQRLPAHIRDAVTEAVSLDEQKVYGKVRDELQKLRPTFLPRVTDDTKRDTYARMTPNRWRVRLEWLGTLRRARCCRGWKEFDDFYGRRSDVADLRKQIRWAEALIAWLQDGDDAHIWYLPDQMKAASRLLEELRQIAPPHFTIVMRRPERPRRRSRRETT
jgi:hypothetical protein